MNKRLLVLFFAVLLCVVSIAPAFAQPAVSRLVDDAMLLSDYEAEELLTKLDEISERQQLDVVVVTVNTLDGKTPRDYADDYFDYNGFGFGSSYDGVLLLISMEDRDWYISTSGYGITAFTDAGIEYIGEEMLYDLSEGFYFDALNTYASLCDEFITESRNGQPFDNGNLPKGEFSFFATLFIAIIVGAVVAGIVCLVFALQLKSVRYQSAASSYIKQGSMNVTDSREIYLYSNTTRQKKVQQSSGGSGSSTHMSSSGRTHGGGGGKF